MGYMLYFLGIGGKDATGRQSFSPFIYATLKTPLFIYFNDLGSMHTLGKVIRPGQELSVRAFIKT